MKKALTRVEITKRYRKRHPNKIVEQNHKHYLKRKQRNDAMKEIEQLNEALELVGE